MQYELYVKYFYGFYRMVNCNYKSWVKAVLLEIGDIRGFNSWGIDFVAVERVQ